MFLSEKGEGRREKGANLVSQRTGLKPSDT
jgi:hypothetical protein